MKHFHQVVFITILFAHLCATGFAQTDSSVSQTPIVTNPNPLPPISRPIVHRRISVRDTIHQAVAKVRKLNSVKSILNDYGNIPITQEANDDLPQPLRPTGLPAWLFWVFLVQLALIAFVRAQYTREFSEVFIVFINSNLTQQLYRETQAGGVRIGYMLLNLNFVISLGMWIFLAIKQNGTVTRNPDAYLMPAIIIGVALLLAARFISLRLASWLLRSSREIGLFGFTDLQLFRATGLLLFLVNVFVAYSQAPFRFYFFMFSLIVLVTFLLFRFLRGFEIGRTYFGQNFFHFLVYICALEIAPVLIGIRYFLNSFEL